MCEPQGMHERESDHFIAGWIGGLLGLVVGHPLETIKVRQQTFGSSLPEAISRTFRYEGVHGFYKGMMFPMLTVGASNALFFGVYGNILKFLENSMGTTARHNLSFADKDNLVRVYIAGCGAGVFQAMFMCPWELIKTMLQANTEGKGSWKRPHTDIQYNGSIDALKSIYSSRGIRGLFRGLTIMLIRDVPTSGIYTLSYGFLLNVTFDQWETSLLTKQMVAGGLTGIMAWAPIIPADVIKSQIQSDDPEHPCCRTIKEYFLRDYRSGGFRIFFRGLPAVVIRAFPVNAAIFMGYEGSLLLLRHP